MVNGQCADGSMNYDVDTLDTGISIQVYNTIDYISLHLTVQVMYKTALWLCPEGHRTADEQQSHLTLWRRVW